MDYVNRDEMIREIKKITLIGDDSSIMVTDTAFGQVAQEIGIVEGAGEVNNAAFDPYFFLATQTGETTVEVESGPFVRGEVVDTVPKTTGIAVTETGWVSLVAYYNSGWQYTYAVQAIQSQGKHSGYWAERFPVAYVTFAGGAITDLEQINIKELRSTRVV